MTRYNYGAEPRTFGLFEPDFTEYMHYMYLPVMIPEGPDGIHLPARLEFARKMVEFAVGMESTNRKTPRSHVYLTARRGYATPGNPLNRPGWHSDGFGTNDINYVWTDRFPTLFALQPFTDISEDHVVSAKQFEQQVRPENIVTYPDRMLMRLDPSVIHSAPQIPAPGGERSFLKVSFSDDRYNLVGNSHNYLLDYDWEMFDRAAVRNDPARAGKDSASPRGSSSAVATDSQDAA